MPSLVDLVAEREIGLPGCEHLPLLQRAFWAKVLNGPGLSPQPICHPAHLGGTLCPI